MSNYTFCRWNQCHNWYCTLESEKENRFVKIIIFMILNVILLIFILVANATFIYGLWFSRLRQSRLSIMDKLLLLQASMDLVSGLVIFPGWIYLLQHTGDSCDVSEEVAIIKLVFYHIALPPIYCTLAISQTRYLNITDGLTVASKRLSLCVSLIAVTANLTMIVGAFVLEIHGVTSSLIDAFGIGLSVTGGMILALFIVFNFLLWRHVKRNAMPNELAVRRYERTLTKTIVLVNICLIVCLVPGFILNLVVSYIRGSTQVMTLQQFKALGLALDVLDNLLFSVNSGLNAVVYTVRIRKIQRFYVERFGCCMKRKQKLKEAAFEVEQPLQESFAQ